MGHKYTPVTAEFFDTAPITFINEIEINSTPEKIFSIFENGEAWSDWFVEIKSVNWTSPKPYKVGTTRTILFHTIEINENFFRWEDGKRFSFYFESTSVPLGEAFAEDYQLIEQENGTTKFIYTVAVDPGSIEFDKDAFTPVFKQAAISLKKYVENL